MDALFDLATQTRPSDDQAPIEKWEEACAYDDDLPQDRSREMPDGSIYTGQFREGAPQGFGRMDWPMMGKCYIGEWKNGKMHGRGLLASAGQSRWLYSGQFADGQRNGNGRCEWPDRCAYYDGDWVNGYQHGIGENGSRSMEYPLFCLWEKGLKKQSLANSTSRPTETEVFPTIILHKKYATYTPHDSQAEEDELEIVMESWGFAVGNPNLWNCGKVGALMITRIFEEGPLASFHDGQGNDVTGDVSAEVSEEVIKVLPNSFIWKVDNIQGDGVAMLDTLRSPTVDKVTIQIRFPPFVRALNIKRNLHKRQPWFNPCAFQDTGWRPWLDNWARKTEVDMSHAEFDPEKQHLQLIPPQPEELLRLPLEIAASVQVSEPGLPSLGRVGEVPPPKPRLVAAIRINDRAGRSIEKASRPDHVAQPQTLGLHQKTNYWERGRRNLEQARAAQEATYW